MSTPIATGVGAVSTSVLSISAVSIPSVSISSRALGVVLLAAAAAFLPARAGVAAQEGDRPAPVADEPIPEIPPDKLPPRTGKRPDPATEQYVRGRVAVRFRETVKPRQGESYTPRVPVIENYLGEYFRRAGFEVVEAAAQPQFTVVGEFEGAYKSSLILRGQTIGLKFRGSARVEILDAAGARVGAFEIPEIENESVARGLGDARGEATEKTEGGEREPAGGEKPVEKDDKTDGEDGGKKDAGTDGAAAEREESVVVLDLRREMAKLVWGHIFYGADGIADREVIELLASLAREDFDAPNPVHADDVLRQLVERRLAVVPYLIEALTDERLVLVSAKYPGLTALNTDKLRIYHIADRALEEIFQKVSRMSLDTPREHRFVILRGWEAEWRRFCKPYRESPLARPGGKTAGR